MKKFLLLSVLFVESISPCFARDFKLNVRDDANGDVVLLKQKKVRGDFELMEPVFLKNPSKVRYGFDAGAPKRYVPVVSKPVVKTKKVDVSDVKPVVLPAMPETMPVQVKEEVKPVEAVVAEPVILPMPEENRKPVVDDVKIEPENRENVIADIKKEQEPSQTDKNIDEAKKLLQAAEKLANSVIDDEEKESKVEAKEVKKDIEAVVETKKAMSAKFAIKFKKDVEELSKADEKKLEALVDDVKNNSESMLKIVSYYSAIDGRNVAFSRLLNARKVLLERDVPTSQIMIMVLEDDDKVSPKADTIEVFFE